MDVWLTITALVMLLAVVALGVVVLAARRRPRSAADSRLGLGMAGGMLFGAVLGTIVWISTGDFTFWVVFIGGGLATGLAIGSARAPKPH